MIADYDENGYPVERDCSFDNDNLALPLSEPLGGPVIRVAKSRSRRKPDNTAIETVFIYELPLPYWLYRKGRVRLWLVKDCCGIVCVIITWLLIFYGQFSVNFLLIGPFPLTLYTVINMAFFQLCSIFGFIAHVRSIVCDPGSVPKGNATLENIIQMGYREGEIVYKCSKCSCVKEERTHHCSVCRRCIRKMDHHCPWINNCVGEANLKYFILFCLYIMLISIQGVVMSIVFLFTCFEQHWRACPYWSPPSSIILAIVTMIEAIIFALFTGSMLWQQVDAIFEDETVVEQMKKDRPKSDDKASRWNALKGVFGHPFSWRWFSPFSEPNFYRNDFTPLVQVNSQSI